MTAQVRTLTKNATEVAEVRDNERIKHITSDGTHVRCDCGWNPQRNTLLPVTACRHVQAYWRAVRLGQHLIVRDQEGPLFVVLRKGIAIDPEFADAYALAIDLMKGAGSAALHAAANKILDFARAHGATVPETRRTLARGKTRRIVIVDTDGD